MSVKEAVLPFDRFPDVDSLLGPEMRSTGEVMGIDRTFGLAFAKSQIAAGNRLPAGGVVFMSLADRDKELGGWPRAAFAELGFSIFATEGTAAHLEANGVEVAMIVAKVGDGAGDAPQAPQADGGTHAGDAVQAAGAAHAADAHAGREPGDGRYFDARCADAVELIEQGRIQLVVNTPSGRGPRADGAYIRRAASANGVPCLTTVAAARAAAAGIADWGRHSCRSAPCRSTMRRPPTSPASQEPLFDVEPASPGAAPAAA